MSLCSPGREFRSALPVLEEVVMTVTAIALLRRVQICSMVNLHLQYYRPRRYLSVFEPIQFVREKHKLAPLTPNIDIFENSKEREGERGDNSSDNRGERLATLLRHHQREVLSMSSQDEPAAVYQLSQALANLEVGVMANLVTIGRCWTWIRGGHILKAEETVVI